MDLGSFGAILRFAIELEEQVIALYETSAREDNIFSRLIQDGKKRTQRLERARREGVVEMVLEPITGFDSDAYSVKPVAGSNENELDLLRMAVMIEDTMIRFYRDAADKMPVLGVARLLQRLADENKRRKAQLADEVGN
ncbi:MAG: hypothetical protein ABFS37_08080 [Acidobacteriota bacterium]